LLISTHDVSVLQDTAVRVLALRQGELQPATTFAASEGSGQV